MTPFEASDTYTQYELLAPASHQFRVTYFVTELAVGAALHINGVRPGSVESDLSVDDVESGAPLAAEEVSGQSLLDEGVAGEFEPGERFVRIPLSRPVAPGAEGRVRVNKTYMDAKSYWAEENSQVVVFKCAWQP